VSIGLDRGNILEFRPVEVDVLVIGFRALGMERPGKPPHCSRGRSKPATAVEFEMSPSEAAHQADVVSSDATAQLLGSFGF
jgi:hypothetical protein